MAPRTPVYYLAHGGPNLWEDVAHPAHKKLQQIGREITTQVKPTAVVVLSAHWQGGPRSIEVNTAESQDLIYDFYGFPAHYYKLKYPNKGSPQLASRVLDTLKSAGINAKGSHRGLDHGVYVSFTVAFNPETNPLNVPIVQVSLYDNEDAAAHMALGRALAPLRDEGVVIIGSGMVVHNLRDFQRAMFSSQPLSYAEPFDKAVKAAAESELSSREEKMTALLRDRNARAANPSFEHLLPIHIAAGAAGSDLGKQLWTKTEGSVSWAMYRFGDVAASA